MTLDRRTLLAASAATLAVGAAQPSFAQGTTPLASAQAPGFYRFKIGDLQVTAVHDGNALRPTEGFIRNAELPAVQAALAEAGLPTAQLNNSFTALVVNNGGKVTVIDAGNGNSGAPTTGLWLANFRAAGFDPANVSTVLVSHFHGDHISGLRLRDGTAVFPNAEIMVPAGEWAFWMDDSRMNAAPEAARGGFMNARRVFAPIAADVKRFEPGKELVSGVTAIPAFGHTPGHVAFVIASGNDKLLMVVDAINHPALFVRNPGWHAIFDMDPAMAEATRRRLLDMAVADKLQTSFYHAPFPATGQIIKEGSGFRMMPVTWNSII